MSRFKFTTGPWNVADGVDVYGPATRRPLGLEEKVAAFAELGFSAVQFHDDDAVPEISSKSSDEIRDEARGIKAMLDRYQLGAEFVAPRLWFEPQFKDGAYTAPIRSNWDHAMWRTYRSIDIAKELGAKFIVLWLAREGTLCMESKAPVPMIKQLIASLDAMLEYDPDIKIAIEPKPNEPIDRSYAALPGMPSRWPAGPSIRTGSACWSSPPTPPWPGWRPPTTWRSAWLSASCCRCT